MNPTARPFANPDVICRNDFDDTLILFHPHLAQAIPARGVARDLWRALDGTRTLAEIADALSAQYAQSPQIVLDDARAFTRELSRRLFVLTEPPLDAPLSRERPRQFIIPEGTPAPARDTESHAMFRLPLANGTTFILRAMDADAARVVNFFAESARLEKPEGSPRPFGFETILVATRPFDAPGEIVCLIDPPHAQKRDGRRRDANGIVVFEYKPLVPTEWLWLQVIQLAACIGARVQTRGGILLHGALAAYPTMSFRAKREISAIAREISRYARNDIDGVGVLLTAHSGVGKSTASKRLPAPWVSLCDDTTLIVRDDTGAYWTHPMPTWSHIFCDEKIRTWDTQSAAPLRAIFLLRQAEQDRVTPVSAADAIGFLLERAQEPTQYWRENFSLRELGAFNREQFDNLCELVRAVPCFLLDARLDGEFWREMEIALRTKDKG